MNVAGLEASEEQLRRVIKYANKLEKKGDLESIRLCFAIKQSVATTLFTEQFDNKFRVWTKEIEPLKDNESLDLFCELWDLNQFDEVALLKRIPVDGDSILKQLFDASVDYQNILDGIDFREQLSSDYSKRICTLKHTSYYNKLNNIMKTSDEQFVQTLLVIQDFKDIELIKEAYVQYVNNTNVDNFTDKIAWEVEKKEYTRLDNGNINKYMYVCMYVCIYRY